LECALVVGETTNRKTDEREDVIWFRFVIKSRRLDADV
jgi:hypothetical protein